MRRRAHATPVSDQATVVAGVPAPVGTDHSFLFELQRSAGNRAVTRLLQPRLPVQRKDKDDLVPWKEGTFGFLGRGAGLLGGAFALEASGASLLMEAMAKDKINSPIFSRCIDRYKEGSGKELHLTAAEVEQQWVDCNLFGGGFAKVKKARDELTAKGRTGQTRHIDKDAGMAQALAFGTCTLTMTGDLSYTKGMGCTFTGSFTLFDRWDFNVEGLKTHRGFQNELETIGGRFLLPGRPFDVTSDAVPINMKESDSTMIIPDRR